MNTYFFPEILYNREQQKIFFAEIEEYLKSVECFMDSEKIWWGFEMHNHMSIPCELCVAIKSCVGCYLQDVTARMMRLITDVSNSDTFFYPNWERGDIEKAQILRDEIEEIIYSKWKRYL